MRGEGGGRGVWRKEGGSRSVPLEGTSPKELQQIRVSISVGSPVVEPLRVGCPGVALVVKGQYPLPGPRVEGGGWEGMGGEGGGAGECGAVQRQDPLWGPGGLRWQCQQPCKGSGVELVVMGQYP